MEVADLKNAKKIIAPVNNHNGRQININIDGDNNAPIIIDSEIAKTIMHNANEEEKLLTSVPVEPIENTENKENVILRLKQIRDVETNTKNTKGIILEVDSKEYPVMFVTPELTARIIHASDNPLLKNYLVDIKINKVNESIKAFTILDLHDSYIDEEELHEGNLFS